MVLCGNVTEDSCDSPSKGNGIRRLLKTNNTFTRNMNIHNLAPRVSLLPAPLEREKYVSYLSPWKSWKMRPWERGWNLHWFKNNKFHRSESNYRSGSLDARGFIFPSREEQWTRKSMIPGQRFFFLITIKSANELKYHHKTCQRIEIQLKIWVKTN